MSYEFRPAVRTKTSVLISIASASGGGKTMSALYLATGLAGPNGKIAFIDTEGGRALHYADMFKFDHCEIVAPFRPDTYIDAVESAEKAGYDVIIIDSMSHVFEGAGGILEWADEEEAAGVKSPGNWKKPKTAHKKMVNRLVQCRSHLIFCLRAEEKMLLKAEPLFNNDGTPKMWNGKPSTKMVVVPAEQRPLLERWVPICEKRFPFEMTASFLMLPSNPGVGIPIKLQDQHRPMFPTGERIGQASGAALAAWSHGRKSGGEPIKAQAGDGAPTGDDPTPAERKTKAEAWLKRYEKRILAASDRAALVEVTEWGKAAVADLKQDFPDLFREAERYVTDRNIDLDADEEGAPADSQRGEGNTLFGED